EAEAAGGGTAGGVGPVRAGSDRAATRRAAQLGGEFVAQFRGRSRGTEGGGVMIDPDDLIERHRSARLLKEVCRPQSAAVLAQLPARPGVGVAAAEVQRSSGLSPRTFWATVSRLEDVGVLR